MIGELDESFRWLEHAVKDRCFLNYRFMEEIDPTLENLRHDPAIRGVDGGHARLVVPVRGLAKT